MAVAADQGHAGLGEPQFRPDNVDDTLARVGQGNVVDAEFAGIGFQERDLSRGLAIEDRAAAVPGRNGVIGHRELGLR